MITNLFAAQLCQLVYSPTNTTFDHILNIHGVVAGIKYVGGDTVIAFRGSDDVEDWIRDAWVIPTYTAELGWVHGGFYDGIPEFVADAKPLIIGKLICVGHSLGSAHAIYTGALLKAVQISVFGSPRPSMFFKLGSIIKDNGTLTYSAKNWHDVVTGAPSRWFGWRHAIPQTGVQSEPEPDDDIDDHMIARYVQALGG